jgi:arylsulfatase A-like enzyme
VGRWFFALTFVIGVLTSCTDRGSASSASTVPPNTAVPPNVIVILTDDQTVGTLQLMPNVRALAGRGTSFANAFISNSLCCPSRSAILTGLTSGHTGVWTNGDHDRRWGGWSSFTHNALTQGGKPYDGGSNDNRTIAVALRDAGYQTGLFGKYLNHYEVPGGAIPAIPPGWTNWFAFLGKNGDYYNYPIDDQGQVERYGSAPHDYSTDVVGRAARGFLQSPGIQDGSQPFFLYYAPFAPHGRWVPGPRDRRVKAPVPFESPAFGERNLSDKPVFVRNAHPLGAKRIQRLAVLWNRVYGTLRDVDRWVGRFQRALPPSVLDNTVFIFMSDNGLEWGDHGLTYKGYPYERSIAVPLIFAGPGIVHGVNRGLASNLDITPTIADLTGVSLPGPLDGTSLVPALAGTGPIPTKGVLLEHLSMWFAPSYCGLRTRRWKYVVYRTGTQELYDLRRDPYELQNLARMRPLVRARLRARTLAACDPRPPDWNTHGRRRRVHAGHPSEGDST